MYFFRHWGENRAFVASPSPREMHNSGYWVKALKNNVFKMSFSISFAHPVLKCYSCKTPYTRCFETSFSGFGFKISTTHCNGALSLPLPVCPLPCAVRCTRNKGPFITIVIWVFVYNYHHSLLIFIYHFPFSNFLTKKNCPLCIIIIWCVSV